MVSISRRTFLQLSATTGGALVFGDLASQILSIAPRSRQAHAAEPIKVGIIDPLRAPIRPRRSTTCTVPM
jgi:branched-chain amino acid transport system substrate-binding protein